MILIFKRNLLKIDFGLIPLAVLTITRYVRRTGFRPSGLSHWVARQILLFGFACDVSDLQSVTTSR